MLFLGRLAKDMSTARIRERSCADKKREITYILKRAQSETCLLNLTVCCSQQQVVKGQGNN